MEARIAKLEELTSQTRESLVRVETKVDHIAGDTGQFKWFAIGAGLTIVLTIIGTALTVQQMTRATFSAAAQQAQQPAAPQQPIIITIPAGAQVLPASSPKRP